MTVTPTGVYLTPNLGQPAFALGGGAWVAGLAINSAARLQMHAVLLQSRKLAHLYWQNALNTENAGVSQLKSAFIAATEQAELMAIQMTVNYRTTYHAIMTLGLYLDNDIPTVNLYGQKVNTELLSPTFGTAVTVPDVYSEAIGGFAYESLDEAMASSPQGTAGASTATVYSGWYAGDRNYLVGKIFTYNDNNTITQGAPVILVTNTTGYQTIHDPVLCRVGATWAHLWLAYRYNLGARRKFASQVWHSDDTVTTRWLYNESALIDHQAVAICPDPLVANAGWVVLGCWQPSTADASLKILRLTNIDATTPTAGTVVTIPLGRWATISGVNITTANIHTGGGNNRLMVSASYLDPASFRFVHRYWLYSANLATYYGTALYPVMSPTLQSLAGGNHGLETQQAAGTAFTAAIGSVNPSGNFVLQVAKV